MVTEGATKPVAPAHGSQRTFGAGYIVPHPSLRRDAVDVDSFMQDHQVYTPEYLESVRPAHHNPSKCYEVAAWWWHVAMRTIIGVLTGTLGMSDRVSERALAMRLIFFCSAGTAFGAAAGVASHAWAVLRNKPDNGWVHTTLANGEAVRTHWGVWSALTGPPFPARVAQLALQAALVFQLLLVYAFFPSVAHAYDAYRAEEQVFNLSQALALIDRGSLKGWRGARAPALAASFYALPEGALLRDAVLRMRADEACIHHLDRVLADLVPGAKNPFITTQRMADKAK